MVYYFDINGQKRDFGFIGSKFLLDFSQPFTRNIVTECCDKDNIEFLSLKNCINKASVSELKKMLILLL